MKGKKKISCALEGPVLVLAGAGSGKTTVLMKTELHMISEKHIRPWNILAITFTNKAAREMKDRIEDFWVIPQRYVDWYISLGLRQNFA